MLTSANITRANILAAGAVAVERKPDNSGTFVLNADMHDVAFIPNSMTRDGVWLYYSADVRKWLGLPSLADYLNALEAA